MDDQLKHMNLDDSLTEQLSRELAQASGAIEDSDGHTRVEENADEENTDTRRTDEENTNIRRADEENTNIRRADEENTNIRRADEENTNIRRADEENVDTGRADKGSVDARMTVHASGRREKKRTILSKPLSIDILPPEQKRSMQERELSLMLKTHGRAFSQALMTIAGTPQRSGRLWMIAGATLVVIVMLIIQVYYRHRELNLGYVLSEAISQREALHEENRKLRIELRVLSRRERLEPMADRQLGMTVIRPEQVLIVDEAPRTRTAQDAQ